VEDTPGQRVETEEMHPDRPGGVHLGICAAMVLLGIGLILGAALGSIWGPIRVVFALGGVVLLLLGSLQALGVTKLKIGASGKGGIEASAEMPTGYTKTMTVSDSLEEGIMPPKEGTMPAKSVEGATPAPPARLAGETAQDRPRSSAEP
jgi:hypothetical protein